MYRLMVQGKWSLLPTSPLYCTQCPCYWPLLKGNTRLTRATVRTWSCCWEFHLWNSKVRRAHWIYGWWELTDKVYILMQDIPSKLERQVILFYCQTGKYRPEERGTSWKYRHKWSAVKENRESRFQTQTCRLGSHSGQGRKDKDRAVRWDAPLLPLGSFLASQCAHCAEANSVHIFIKNFFFLKVNFQPTRATQLGVVAGVFVFITIEMT